MTTPKNPVDPSGGAGAAAAVPSFDAGIREAVPMPVGAGPAQRLGPDSLVWKYFGDIRGNLLGFQRLAGTENSIEQLAKGVEDHSIIFSDLIGRGRRSGPPIAKTVYSAEAAEWGRRVRDFHRDIKGTIDSDGSRYHALNPELYYWAHATFVDQVIYTTDTFIRRLSEAEKEQIFEESKIWYGLYGVSARSQPETYAEFLEYWDSMLARFVPTRTIVYATGYIRRGLPRPKRLRAVPLPVWRAATYPLNAMIRTVVVGTLPPQMRDVCGLDWDERRERRFQRFARTMRAVNPLFNRLPVRVLYTPWAAEAWERTGVDPRTIHNGGPASRGQGTPGPRRTIRGRVLAEPPAGSGLKPIRGTYLPTPREVWWALRAPERALARRRELFGDISFAYSPLEGAVVTPAGPDGCAAVALNKDRAFASEPGWGLMIGRFFRRGLLLMDFEEHRYHRLVMQQAFGADHLRAYLDQMQPMIRRRIADFPEGDGIRILHEFKSLTLDIALEIFLGLELPRAEADRINTAFVDCVQACLGLVRYDVPGTRWSRGLAGRRTLEEFLRRQLPAKRATRTPDLFSTLCHLGAADGNGLGDQDIVDHMIFVLMAAHDTSTITLATMTYYLARHPEWQERARAQSRELPATLTYDALPRYTLLDHIMKEALRLNPPVPGLVRQAIEDTEIDGYFVPRGTRVTVPAMANHYNPELWTDPESFDPGRFGADRAEDRSHRFAWMPFGGGAHKCIGLYFGQMEIKTIMHNLLLTHEWSVPDGYTWQLDHTTLPVPRDGLPVRVGKI